MDVATLGIKVESSGVAQASGDLDKLSKSTEQAEKATKKKSDTDKKAIPPVEKYTKKTRNAAFAVGNLGAQFNDIGVMIAAGQDPLQLALQQGTQIGQIWTQTGVSVKGAGKLIVSALGSVLSPVNLLTIGLIAGGSALIQWAMSASDAEGEASKLEKNLETARENMEKLNDEVRGFRLGVSSDELYLLDAIAEQMRELADASDLLNGVSGRNKKGAANRVASEQEVLTELQNQLAEMRNLQMEKETLKTLTNETADAERMLGEQMSFVAQSAEETEQIASLLKAGISATVIEAMALAGVDMANPLIDAQTAAELLKLGLTDSQIAAIELAGINISDPITVAANEAERLANNLFLASRVGLRKTVSDEDALFSQSLEPASTTNAVSSFNSLVASANKRANKKSGPSAAETAAQKEFNASQREASKWILETETALEAYNRELADLAELNDMGFFAEKPEAYARAIGMVKEEFNEANMEPFQDAIESISDAFADAIVNGEDLGDAFSSILKQMAADIISSNIQQLLTGALSPSAGGTTAATGGLFSSILGGLLSFDGGGYTGSGARSGGLDGKGGYMAMVHPNETVIDHTKGQSSGGSSYAPSYQIDARGADQAAVARLEQTIQDMQRNEYKRFQAHDKNLNQRGIRA